MAASCDTSPISPNVQTRPSGGVAAGQFTDANTVDHVNTILADLTTALSAATAS